MESHRLAAWPGRFRHAGLLNRVQSRLWRVRACPVPAFAPACHATDKLTAASAPEIVPKEMTAPAAALHGGAGVIIVHVICTRGISLMLLRG